LTDWAKFPEYDAFIAEGVARGDSHSTIAEGMMDAFGIAITKDQVGGRLRRKGVTSVPPETTPEERFEAAAKRARDKAADLAIAREMASAAKAQARWDEFLDIFRGELGRTPRADTVRQLVVPQGSGTPETMTVLIGDIHIGKLADPPSSAASSATASPSSSSAWRG
jgi:hypothetical protein